MKWKKNAAMLSLALALGLTGCGIVDVVNNEVRADYELREEAIVYPASQKEVKKSAEAEATLANFELVLQNDYLELYIGKYYDIAVYEKTTGKLTLSNQAFYDLGEEAIKSLGEEAKRVMLSQVAVEYYTPRQTKMSMASYPDAYSPDKNQVTWNVEGDTLTVSYGIGTSMEESPIVEVFTKETFEGYVEQLAKLLEEGAITTFNQRDFVNNYYKYTYSEMTDADKATYKRLYPSIEELGTIYVVNDNLTARVTNNILAVYTVLGCDEPAKLSRRLRRRSWARSWQAPSRRSSACRCVTGSPAATCLCPWT